MAFLTILLFSVWFAGIPGWKETCLTEHPPTQGVLSQQKGAWESVGTVSATWTSLCSASEVTEKSEAVHGNRHELSCLDRAGANSEDSIVRSPPPVE